MAPKIKINAWPNILLSMATLLKLSPLPLQFYGKADRAYVYPVSRGYLKIRNLFRNYPAMICCKAHIMRL